MKTRVLTLVAALAIVMVASGTADAARVVYRRVAPGPLYLGRPVVVAPVYPRVYSVVTPMTTTVVSPNIVIGPRGHIRYVAPVRTIGTPVYFW